MSHCFKYATNNKTQVLAKQLRLYFGILLRDAVRDFLKKIAEFLNQYAFSAGMVCAAPSG